MMIFLQQLIKKKTLFIAYFLSILIIFIVKAILPLNAPLLSSIEGMGDAHSRVLLANYHHIPTQGMWLPLHIKIMEIALFLHDDIFITPRVLSIVFSLTSLIYLKKISSFIGRNKASGFIAMTIFTLSNYFTRYASIPLSEPMQGALLLASLSLLFEKKYAFSSIIMLLATLTRFESWFLIPIFFTYICLTARIKTAIEYLSIVCLGPLYWLLSNYWYTNDFFYFFKQKISLANANMKVPDISIMSSTFKWVKVAISEVGLGFFSIATFSFFTEKNKKEVLLIKAISIYLLLLLAIQVTSGSMEWYPKQYVYIQLLLLIIPMSIFLEKITLLIPLKKVRVVAVFLLITLFTFISVRKTAEEVIALNEEGIPQIAQILKGIGDDEYSYVYPSSRYPLDSDYIFYSSRKLYVYLADFETFKKRSCNEPTYVLFDNMKEERTPCEPCQVLYRDNRYTLKKCFNNAYLSLPK